MAGCSIVVLWLLSMPIVILGITAGFGLLIYLLYSWIFESIFCASLCKNRWGWKPVLGWIPVWGQYLLGRATGARKMGLLLELDHLIVLVLCMVITTERVQVNSVVFLFFIALGVVLKAILAHRLYKMLAPQHYKVYAWASVLSMGLLRPVFLFVLRKKVIMFSKNT